MYEPQNALSNLQDQYAGSRNSANQKKGNKKGVGASETYKKFQMLMPDESDAIEREMGFEDQSQRYVDDYSLHPINVRRGQKIMSDADIVRQLAQGKQTEDVERPCKVVMIAEKP